MLKVLCLSVCSAGLRDTVCGVCCQVDTEISTATRIRWTSVFPVYAEALFACVVH